jgi:hypothetical protein
MRGIGKGQTIALIVPPEVSRLVQADLSTGRGVLPENQPLLQSGQGDENLRDVASWLLLNGMRSERTQANMLLCQNTGNVWKKRAYRELLKLDSATILAGGVKMSQFSTMLFAWKEGTDSKVLNTIPDAGSLEKTLRSRVADLRRLGVLTVQADLDEIERIISTGLGTATSSMDQINITLEGEQVQEQEQEQVLFSFEMASYILLRLDQSMTCQCCRAEQPTNVSVSLFSGTGAGTGDRDGGSERGSARRSGPTSPGLQPRRRGAEAIPLRIHSPDSSRRQARIPPLL